MKYLIALLMLTSIFAYANQPSETTATKAEPRPCLAGMPEGASLGELPAVRFDFGPRTIMMESKCSQSFKIHIRDSFFECQVCGEKRMEEPTRIGSRAVLSLSPAAEKNAAFTFVLEAKDNNPLKMRCASFSSSVVDDFRGINSVHFTSDGSAQRFMDALASANVTCSQVPHPKESSLHKRVDESVSPASK